MPEPREECRPVILPTGETIVVRGAQPMTEQGAAALAEVVAVVRRMIPPPPPEAVDLYARLDTARFARGLTWRELAKEAGVRATVLSRLANGTVPDAGDRERLEAWQAKESDGS